MNAETLALHVLRALAEAQVQGSAMNLELLAAAIRVRRRDLRGTVTALHAAGLVDALRMRVTLRGFALGAALSKQPLPPLRTLRAAVAAA